MEHVKTAGTSFVMILTSILIVAIIAVLVSNNSQTASVVQSFGTTFSQILGVIVAPIGSSSGGSSGSVSPVNSQGSFTLPSFAS